MANFKKTMVNFKDFLAFFFISVLSLFCLASLPVEGHDDRKVYIAYLGSISEEYSLSSDYHLGILQQVIEGSTAEDSLVRSYRRSFNGFAAKLTKKEYENLKSMKGVVSVFPSRTLQVQTTRSWDFIGFPATVRRDKSSESNTIVGVIDTGIWPESLSFRDDGFGPAPKKWKGVCKGGANFTCNNKLIGARTYLQSATARDERGHGSHTASTAAGRSVKDASFYGLAQGYARGGVPSARIAVYKVCDPGGCQESDLIAAFDDAIADGVDLITISIGGPANEFDRDAIAIGAFHAMEKGILTVQSAGNDGEIPGVTVGSTAPWLFTVGAGSTDRRILDKVILANGKTLVGSSINSFTLKGDKFPLVYGKGVTSQCSEEGAKLCADACLDKRLVKGKIVVCDDIAGINAAFRAGALGALSLGKKHNTSFIVPLPAVALGKHEFDALKSCLNSTRTPKAKILKSEATNDTDAPFVVSFSSRGPNGIASDILKPDITAPGSEILAAYSPFAHVSDAPEDRRSVKYSILSGTSMSCPHVAGAAAYLKSLHPDWSPTAIKSALMTTARPMSPSKNPEGEFAYGSGFLNPVKGTNPGLVYETTKDDYIRFLCSLNYDKDQIRLISGDKNSSCPKKIDKNSSLSPKDVNYPSMSAMVANGGSFRVKFHRTVTNVGVANSTYKAEVNSGSSKIKVTVEPNSLSFKSLKEQKSFDVTVVGEGLSSEIPVSASLVWSDGIHSVRSPIVMYKA